MKFSKLENKQQDALVVALGRYVYPLYITTGVDGFDYHFIGTTFLLNIGERRFFIFTHHQSVQANNGDLCIGYPQESTKFIRVHNTEVRKFTKSDLAIFECDNGCPDDLHSLDSSLVLPPTIVNDLEAMVVGHHIELNTVDHEAKKIIARKIAIITENIDLKEGFDSIQLDYSTYCIAVYPQHIEKLNSFHNVTQGLSGSPIFAFRVISTNESKGELDMNLIGVATHVAEAQSKLNATRTHELIACLHLGFSAYPELDEIRSKIS